MEHELAPSSIEQEQIKAPASSSSVQAKSVVGGGRTHPVLGLQRKVGNRVVQGLVNADKSSVSPAIRTVLSSGGAQPLDQATRALMEPRFEHDFSHVRVHTNERAAGSARAVNALAYTVGQDVVFDTGQYAPYSSTGQSLLAHELAHVVQQGRGGVSPSPFTANTSNESAAREAASMVTSGSVANVGGASGVGVACMPRSSEVSSNLSGLNFTELEDRINEIQQHLDDNPVSSPENDQLMEEQSALRKELAKRQKQEKGGSKRRSQVSPLLIPRSLTESLRIDETLPEMELYHEINAIHATLESGVNKKDQEHLKAALLPLEAEKQRRERARKIQRAFAPKVTSTDREALIETMGLIESIRPSETMSGQYTFVRNGKMLMLTQEEYGKIISAAHNLLYAGLRRVRVLADDAQNQYNAQKEINHDQYIVSGIVHFFGGIDDPGSDIAQDVRRTILNADAAQVLIAHGQFKRGAEFFALSEEFATIAKKISRDYVGDLISTAGTTVTVLEITRNAAIAIDLVLGGFVIAPSVGVGALVGGGLNVVRQGIQFHEGSRTKFSWKELWYSEVAGGVAGKIFSELPALAGLFAARGVVSGIDEYIHGYHETGAFDILTSLLPFFSKQVRVATSRSAGTFIMAAMLGLADAVPATRGTGAAIGNIVEMPVPAMSTAETMPTVADLPTMPAQSPSAEIAPTVAETPAASVQSVPVESVPTVTPKNTQGGSSSTRSFLPSGLATASTSSIPPLLSGSKLPIPKTASEIGPTLNEENIESQVQAAKNYYPGHRGAVGSLQIEGKQPMLIKSGNDGGPWGGTQRGGFPRGKGYGFTSGGSSQGNIATHVEGHAAAIMWQQGIKKAALIVSRIECEICSRDLASALPPGSELTVVSPGNSPTIYRSTHAE